MLMDTGRLLMLEPQVSTDGLNNTCITRLVSTGRLASECVTAKLELQMLRILIKGNLQTVHSVLHYTRYNTNIHLLNSGAAT